MFVSDLPSSAKRRKPAHSFHGGHRRTGVTLRNALRPKGTSL